MKRSFLFFVFFTTACTVGGQQGVFQLTQSRPLSLSEPELRTCVFDAPYSIVHFPMYHEAPAGDDNYELIVKSQFQLLHTLIDYQRALQDNLSVFDEHIASDKYDLHYIQALENGLANADTYTKLNVRVFHYTERYRTASNLFQTSFPNYYEHLNELQKKFLYETGASLTLYLLREIPQIYKVISTTKLRTVKSNLIGNNFDPAIENPNYYWIFTFRDMELRREVDLFYRSNPSYKGLVFIAFGAGHDFSDDFAGLSFQSGHDFCLGWRTPPASVLP